MTIRDPDPEPPADPAPPAAAGDLSTEAYLALVRRLAAAYPDQPVHELDEAGLKALVAGLPGWSSRAAALTRPQAIRILTEWIDLDLDDLERFREDAP